MQIKPIKFFAWEDRWIQRVLDAREVEIGWIKKLRINSVLLQALWTTAPILVSIVSFFAYVIRGNDLDVATAFTVSISRTCYNVGTLLIVIVNAL